ncbi:MAG: toxin-antitoxin system YwqK family antitoxin [Lentimicrobiaceae bacterium]|nr:toxin-antitoxin system YwqK family antitoxin [Lentimicrobiaceae bacterium]
MKFLSCTKQKESIFLLLIFSSFFCLSCRQVERNYYLDGGLESELVYKRGKLDGTAVWYYQHGKKSLEITYKNGRKDGKMMRFFRNGKIETIEYYQNDVLDGLSSTYNENGVLISELFYKNGEKDGIIKQYFPDGSLFFTGQYSENQYDGKWEYFDDEEFKVGEGTFAHGQGILIGYDYEGNITKKVHYFNSLIIKEEYFSTENHKIEKTIIYENGRIIDIIYTK